MEPNFLMLSKKLKLFPTSYAVTGDSSGVAGIVSVLGF